MILSSENHMVSCLHSTELLRVTMYLSIQVHIPCQSTSDWLDFDSQSSKQFDSFLFSPLRDKALDKFSPSTSPTTFQNRLLWTIRLPPHSKTSSHRVLNPSKSWSSLIKHFTENPSILFTRNPHVVLFIPKSLATKNSRFVFFYIFPKTTVWGSKIVPLGLINQKPERPRYPIGNPVWKWCWRCVGGHWRSALEVEMMSFYGIWTLNPTLLGSIRLQLFKPIRLWKIRDRCSPVLPPRMLGFMTATAVPKLLDSSVIVSSPSFRVSGKTLVVILRKLRPNRRLAIIFM